MIPLRHVSDDHAGLRRRRAGAGFVYLDEAGGRVSDVETLDRIRALVIPPAWRDVWICPHANGHIQATGRDARGRKQYRYHATWTAKRDEAKFDRMLTFGKALPKIRRRVSRDLRRPPLSRDRVIAMVVRLLEKTLIRVGNEEYARANHSFGLTTLENRHVKIRGRHLAFNFRAKSGVVQHIDIDDQQLARSVKRCQELPGQKLFEYLDADGQPQTIGSSDVNDYLHEVAGHEFTAKDFRTWAGTVLAASALCEVARENPSTRSRTARARHIAGAIDRVAEALGNTRSVCRKCYVHPAVLEAYLKGVTLERGVPLEAVQDAAALRNTVGDSAMERAVLDLLRRQAGRSARGRRPSLQTLKTTDARLSGETTAA